MQKYKFFDQIFFVENTSTATITTTKVVDTFWYNSSLIVKSRNIYITICILYYICFVFLKSCFEFYFSNPQ